MPAVFRAVLRRQGCNGQERDDFEEENTMQTCSKCDGTGRISCGACLNGNRKILCPDCSGRGVLATPEGQTACGRCRGTGRTTPMSCPYCGNSLPCPACKGSGAV